VNAVMAPRIFSGEVRAPAVIIAAMSPRKP
jgi:hypothetical protein